MLKVYVKKSDAYTVLSLEGQIVTGETEALRGAVESLSSTGAIKLDLARVTAIDAHGLGVLLQLRESTQTKGIRFELMNVSKPMRRIFEITRLNTVFCMTYTVEFFPSVAAERRVSMAALKSCA